MNKEMFVHTTTNAFSIFCLIGGVIIGVLTQYPNYFLMFVQGLLSGIMFWLVAVIISYLFYDDSANQPKR